MRIKLSDHFGYRKLAKFTLPTVAMMVFVSVYGVVDGLFISNFVNETAFTAVNFVWPLLMILGAFGFMLGTGGSALISKTLGEGDEKLANKLFSMFLYVSIALGVALAVVMGLLLPTLLRAMGAEGQMLADCITYGRLILCALPAQILQFEFQSFFVTAEKPTYGFWYTLAAGLTNIALDALFVVGFHWGIAGAAIATGMSQLVGGLLPLMYFMRRKNSSLLRCGKMYFNGRAFWQACLNGASEFLANIAMSVVSILYNLQLMRYAGEPGVAAYGVLMYVNFTFLSCFIGYSVGVAPIIGFNFGAKNSEELKNVLSKSLKIIAVGAVAMLALAQIFARPISYIFVGYNSELLEMTVRGFQIFSFGFLFAGWTIYASSFFTALNNGLISAIISFARTLVCEVIAVLALPTLFQALGGNPLDGIWSSIVIAEVVALIVSVIMLLTHRKRYNY